MSPLRANGLRQPTLALLLAALLLRALLPAGFMPNAQAALRGAPLLVFCSGLALRRVADPAAPGAPLHAVEHCAFAALAAPALAGAPAVPVLRFIAGLPPAAAGRLALPRHTPRLRPPVRAGPSIG